MSWENCQLLKEASFIQWVERVVHTQASGELYKKYINTVRAAKYIVQLFFPILFFLKERKQK